MFRVFLSSLLFCAITNAQFCPSACEPHSNTCDATAPTCIYPDPSIPSPRAACACRAGFKATGYADDDSTKQWRLPVQGNDFRVWVAEGVECNTPCEVPYGVDSCHEVKILPHICLSTAGTWSATWPTAKNQSSYNSTVPGDTSKPTRDKSLFPPKGNHPAPSSSDKPAPPVPGSYTPEPGSKPGVPWSNMGWGSNSPSQDNPSQPHSPGPHSPGPHSPGPHSPGWNKPSSSIPGAHVPVPNNPGSDAPGSNTPGSAKPGDHGHSHGHGDGLGHFKPRPRKPGRSRPRPGAGDKPGKPGKWGYPKPSVSRNITSSSSTTSSIVSPPTTMPNDTIPDYPPLDIPETEEPVLPPEIYDNETIVRTIEEYENSTTLTTFVFTDSEILLDNQTLVLPWLHPTDEVALAHYGQEEYLDDVADAVAYAYPPILARLDITGPQTIQGVLELGPPRITEVGLGLFASPNETVPEGNQDVEEITDPDLEKRGLKWPSVSLPKIRIPSVREVADNLVREVLVPLGNSLEKLGNYYTDIKCGNFAALGVTGFLTQERSVYLRQTGGGFRISRSQMYFLYPIYGSFPLTMDLRAFYNFPSVSGIEQFGAITFNRKMYFLHKNWAPPPWSKAYAHGLFSGLIQTLIHEVRHTRQYANHSWSRASFGFTYMFQYCKSGFSYSNIKYEKQAQATEHLVDDLLGNEFSYAFFEYWRARNLSYTLGYPVQREVVPATGGAADPPYRYQLRFQKGTLLGEGHEPCQRCFKVLGRDESALSALSAACAANANAHVRCAEYLERWAKVDLSYEAFECLPQLSRRYNGEYCE